MKKNLLIAISVFTLTCGVCTVGAATLSDKTTSGSAVTVENKHKDGERQKGDMAKVTAVTSDTLTVTKAEKPDNATDDTNRPEPPAKPDGDTTTPPEKPSDNGDSTDKPEPPAKPDSDKTTDTSNENKGEKPEMKFSSDSTTIDLSSVKIYKMDENHQKTECTYSDIASDDVVTVVYADDGTTVSEIVINKAPKTSASE